MSCKTKPSSTRLGRSFKVYSLTYKFQPCLSCALTGTGVRPLQAPALCPPCLPLSRLGIDSLCLQASACAHISVALNWLLLHSPQAFLVDWTFQSLSVWHTNPKVSKLTLVEINPRPRKVASDPGEGVRRVYGILAPGNQGRQSSSRGCCCHGKSCVHQRICADYGTRGST